MPEEIKSPMAGGGEAGVARYELRLGGDRADDQHEETFELRDGEGWTELRCHDYAEIFSAPGLYEQLFHDELDCRSPDAVRRVLSEAMTATGLDEPLRILDVGAGNGMVAEELDTLDPEAIVGIDIIPEAAEAAWRDRPDLYQAYYVMDLTDMTEPWWQALEDEHFTCMTTVAALGFADIPPLAFANAFNLVADGGFVAFNLKDSFLDGEDDTGFARLVRHMLDEGVLELAGRERYRHRLSVAGEPIHYVALAGAKRSPVPLEWTAE